MNEKCPVCGAASRVYGHHLNKGLGQALTTFFEVYGREPGNPAKIGLTSVQIANWQKLKYWGLVTQLHDHGRWQITSKAIEFLCDKSVLPDKVWTYRGRVVAPLTTTKMVSIYKLVPGYQHREDYSNNGNPDPQAWLGLLR